jgi:hypothetical protein
MLLSVCAYVYARARVCICVCVCARARACVCDIALCFSSSYMPLVASRKDHGGDSNNILAVDTALSQLWSAVLSSKKNVAQIQSGELGHFSLDNTVDHSCESAVSTARMLFESPPWALLALYISVA